MSELRELLEAARDVYDAPSKRYMLFSEEYRDIRAMERDYHRFGEALRRMEKKMAGEMAGKMVFAYGTLRKGDCRFGVPTFVELVHPEAVLEGFQLVHLGGFPGIVPGKGSVKGEVHLYESFETLDRIEGFCQDEPRGSLFVRAKVMVELPGGGELQASTYIFNRKLREEYRVIECGDWFSEEARTSSPL